MTVKVKNTEHFDTALDWANAIGSPLWLLGQNSGFTDSAHAAGCLGEVVKIKLSEEFAATETFNEEEAERVNELHSFIERALLRFDKG